MLESKQMRIQNLTLYFFLLIFFASCNEYQNDGNAVYYKSWDEGNGTQIKKLNGANPKKFRVLEYDDYAKDDRLVFYKGIAIKGADALTFDPIADFYAKDKYRGYYAGDSIRSSKGATFKIIDDYYSTDGNDIFCDTIPLKVTSTKKFRFVFDSGDANWARWATDGKYYYYGSLRVPSDDYAHMTLYKGNGISKDRKWAYYGNHRINYDDSGKRIMDTIDVASFTVTGFLECRDKFGCINVYGKREQCKPN